MDGKMPVFVKIDEYKEVTDTLSVVKSKISDAKSLLASLSDLKEKEDAELESWAIAVEDIEKKMQFIDHSLFEPGNR